MSSELLDDLNDLDYLDKEAPEYIYAGFWKRLGAVILDGIAIFVILIIWVVVAELVGLVLPSGASYFLQEICIPIIMFLYFPLWESSSSQGSIGKQILGIKVIDKDGHRLTFWRALARFFAKFLSYSIGSIGFIMIAFMDKKRGLHDLIVNTYVVDK
jgi:uncharacterized RDD family membrane protein YckC